MSFLTLGTLYGLSFIAQPGLTLTATIFTIKVGTQILYWTGSGMYKTVVWAMDGNLGDEAAKIALEEEWEDLIDDGIKAPEKESEEINKKKND